MILEVIEGAISILIFQALLMTLVVVYDSIPVAGLIVLGYLQIRKRKVGLPNHFLVFLFAALLFPVGEALIGSAAFDTQSDLATNASQVILGLSFLFTVATTIRAKGRRLFVFGVGCAFTIWTFWAMFVTQMSIANSWL
jgi:uncharacterized membrane protein YhiD involved in acid resistance